MQPAQLPQQQQLDMVTPLKAYYAGQQNQRRNALTDRKVALEDKRLAEYDAGAGQRERQSKMQETMNKLNMNKSFTDMGTNMLMGLNPDSPTFNEDMKGVFSQYSKSMVEEYDVNPDTANDIMTHIISSGYTQPGAIRQMQVKAGTMDKPAEAKVMKVGSSLVKIDGDNVTEIFKGGPPPDSTPDTDLDDFVATFKEQYKQENNGQEAPPKLVNGARLQFKRVQAPEAKAVAGAKKGVEAEFAKRISFNKKIGEQLGIAETAQTVIEAKGEITPEVSKQRAKKGVGKSLISMAQDYLDLDSLGAMVNIDNPSYKNIIARSRSTVPGQYLEGFIGTPAQKLRDQISMIKPTLVQDIRKASEMGVRGMDSQKELEFYLQAVTDETRSIQANMAGLMAVDAKYGDGKLSEILESSIDKKYFKSLSSESEALAKEYKKTSKGDVVETGKPAGAAYGGKDPDTGEMTYFDKDGNKL